MSILDKLMEKKDLKLYIDFRIEYLGKILRQTILETPKKDREKIKQRFVGRLLELKKLSEELNQNNIKNKSVFYWNKNKELPDSKRQYFQKIVKNTNKNKELRVDNNEEENK